MKQILLFTFSFFLQQRITLSQDMAKRLSGAQVMEIVKRYHPVARQADIAIEKAKKDVTIARGFFDPVLENENARKTFDGLRYYTYNRPELFIPAWFGVEIRAGFENLSGDRTDPTDTKGESTYIGLTVPIGKNLLMNKRMAALQTARIFREASPVERRNMLNNLLRDAMNNYWNWALQYTNYQILSEAVTVNEKRIALVRNAFLLGDRPAIDTTEALAQLQQFEYLKNQAWLGFQNAGLDLSLYLWTQDTQPYYLPESTIPADNLTTMKNSITQLPELGPLLESARNNHPELLLYDFKLRALNVEKKLQFQELLPSVSFTYNQLGKGYDPAKTLMNPLFENNFQYGIKAGIPLRLSKGRGEYRKVKLGIVETQLQQSQKLLQIENTVKSYFNELAALKGQIALQEKVYLNYFALQRGEETRFRTGESSLFLVYTRENRALEALQKLQELKARFVKANISLYWAAGMLFVP